MSYDSAVRSEYSITTLTSGYVGEENIVNYSARTKSHFRAPLCTPCGEGSRMRQHDDCYSSHHIFDSIMAF